jgi:hypothetical protein
MWALGLKTRWILLLALCPDTSLVRSTRPSNSPSDRCTVADLIAIGLITAVENWSVSFILIYSTNSTSLKRWTTNCIPRRAHRRRRTEHARCTRAATRLASTHRLLCSPRVHTDRDDWPHCMRVGTVSTRRPTRLTVPDTLLAAWSTGRSRTPYPN